MRLILTTILTLCIVAVATAQRFEVEENNKNLKATIGETISTPIKIKNLTDQPLDLVIRRANQVIGSSQKSFFCWNGKCFESETDQLPLQYKVPPNETSIKFESVLETGLAAGYSTVKYIIYDRNHPAEAIEYLITYSVEEVHESERSLIYDSEDLRINDVYPNPVSEYAIIDYNLNNRDLEAKIIIHNVLGSVIGEYRLPYLENKITIKTENFNPGVYFYTLYIDSDGVLTRKLIVRK